MVKSVLKCRYLFFGLVCFLNTITTFAQDADIVRAQQIYEWLVEGKGDSIYSVLNKQVQEKLSPSLFNETFSQIEKTFGKLKNRSQWKRDTAQGVTIYYSDLEFERYALRCLLAFDPDGLMNTIRLVPVPITTESKPKTYDSMKIEERKITVGAKGFTLPATLSLPKLTLITGVNKVPCVILVHGSGPNDRDETVGANKPFRDLAWGLAERGIAVIRYDKRTKVYGASCVPAGRSLDYDTEAVDDAVAIVSQAKQIPEIAGDRIYVLGHSLGATLAPRIAQRSDKMNGIILLAGLARPFEDAIEEQFSYLSSLTNASDAEKARLAILKQQIANVKKLGTENFDEKISLPLNLPRSYWAFANAYKPVEVAKTLTLPILILQGERDYQVTMEDFSLWRSGLLSHKNVFFKSYPKLNHLLQEGTGKSTPFEYNQVSPVPAYVIDDIATFVHKGSL